MKVRFYLAYTLLLLGCTTSTISWEEKSSSVTPSTTVRKNLVGWAVGGAENPANDGWTLLRTVDGGTTWLSMNLPPGGILPCGTNAAGKEYFTAVDTSADGNEVWIVDRTGKLFSGVLSASGTSISTWTTTAIYTGSSGCPNFTELKSVRISDSGESWITGITNAGSTIFQSSDRGRTWTGIPSTAGVYSPVSFFTDTNNFTYAWAPGWDLYTRNQPDNPTSWTKFDGSNDPGVRCDGVPCNSSVFYGVHFVDKNNGLSLWNNKVLTTASGDSQSGLMHWVSTEPMTLDSGSHRLKAFYFPSSTTGWVVGGADTTTKDGTIYRIDTSIEQIENAANGSGPKTNLERVVGGYTYPNQFLSIHGVGDNLWAVGVGGIIVHSSDGGATWTQQTSNTTATLRGVKFVEVAAQ